jgi:spore germination cell wall hydrolase CwlJ-like protein
MRLLFRATGVSVATLAVAAAVAFAGPSQAGESDAAPITSSYIDHETAAPATGIVSEEALNPVETPTLGYSDDLSSDAVSTPVVQHAVVTTFEPVRPEASDDAPVATSRSLAQLVNDYASAETPDAELDCLATAVYFESKSEPLAGQLAVAEVIINRSKSGRFPSTLCGVVKQRSQFSFVRGGRLPAVPRGTAAWRTAVAISLIARNGLAEGKAPKALFFHARRVSPGWRLTRVAVVGNHIFYR